VLNVFSNDMLFVSVSATTCPGAAKTAFYPVALQ